MEWVETTGKDVDEATAKALAHLGVGRDDAEIVVVEEPEKRLFGRTKGEARVRARVRPSAPRPKRSRRGSGGSERGPERSSSRGERGGSGRREGRSRPEGAPKRERAERAPQAAQSRQKSQVKSKVEKEEGAMSSEISLAEQGELAKKFLEGLLDAMGIVASVAVREVDDETVEASVTADPPSELGVLVGPRGTTLQALQEVTRTFVQAKAGGRTDRILVDVAHYRERRVAALGRFAQKVASEVVESGEERALEPMSPADRKAIHDALSENEDVVTRSEGEEPRRFIVIAPA